MTSSWKWVAILGTVGLTACGSDRRVAAGSNEAATSGPIGVRVGVTYGAITLGGDIDLQVTCGSDYSNALRLTPSATDGGTAVVDLAAVPVGVDCAFTAGATEHRADLALDVHCSASLTTRFEADSDHAQVLLVLQRDGGATAAQPAGGGPAADAAPRIEGLSASGNSATVVGSLLPRLEASLSFVPSAAVVLSASVNLGGGGAALRYRWDDGGAGGTFFDLDLDQGLLSPWAEGEWRPLSGGAVPTAIWIPPPGMAGTVRFTLIIEVVGDPAPVPRGISATVVVTVDDSRVQAGFSGVLNHWPDVLSMQSVIDEQSAGGQVVPGQRARVEAEVRDADGDPLAATFDADCPGAFFDADGQQLAFPIEVPDGGGDLSVYFAPATIPDSTYCQVTLEVDDGRGGTTSGYLLLKVLTEAPVAYGPIIDFAQSSARAVGLDTEVQLEVDAHSRYGNPTLSYHVDLLSAVAIPQDNLPADASKLGGFVGDRTNETGSFAWRSPATEEDCLYAESETMNAGATFYFLVTITDEPAQSAGVPAQNYVVIPVDVQCTATP
jgi:hypothetical protein